MKQNHGFLIEKSNPLFSSVRFVLKAVSKARHSDGFDKVSIENDLDSDNQSAVATDGMRLHTCEIGSKDRYPCGVYTPAKTEKGALAFDRCAEGFTYVPWRRIVPDSQVKICDIMVKKNELHTACWPLYTMGIPVNISYIADLALGDTSWVVYQDIARGKESVLVFKTIGCMALVKPLIGFDMYTYPEV